MNDTRSVSLPPLKTRATFQPSTLDRAKRTVELTWTTGARVLRGFWERFYEELSLDPKHVHLDRLNNGAPFLADHDGYRAADTPGVVERAWLTKGDDGAPVGRALVRFVKEGVDPEADKLIEKIADGIVQNVSVGYRVHRLEKVADADDKLPIMRATSWTPFEISAVAIGADDGAGFRSADQDLNPCEVITRGDAPQPKGNAMADDTNPNTDNEEQIRKDERARITEIRSMVQRAQLPEDLADTMIADGTNLDAARALVLEKIGERTQQSQTNGHLRIEAGQRGGHDDFRSAAIDALVMRAGIPVQKPHPAAVDMARTPVLEIARSCLSRVGKRHSTMSAGEILKRALSTSDFPEILSGSVGKSIRQGYETEPASHRLWVRPETVPDFKDKLRPILGSAPDLEQVPELAEYKYGSMTEDAATYRVQKYGRAIALSWELLINDDLGAFLRLQPAMGQAARRKEADTVYALFAENSGNGPTMQDGQILFHATHGNIASTDSGISKNGLSSARQKLRKQTPVGGVGYLSLVPRTLLVPVELETDAELLIASMTKHVTSTTEAEQLEFISRLQLVVEPRLAATAYYMLADSAQIDHVVLGLLEENVAGPVIEEDTEFTRDAYRWKVRHVFGAKFLDWRGIVKVPTT